MKQILIVDDDDLFVESLLRLFRPLGEEWSVDTAPDGRRALELISLVPYDTVVLDIMMPEKEGLETIAELRRDRPDLPVIAMSGGGKYRIDCLEEARLLGARKTLRKPFSLDDLLANLRELCGLEPDTSTRPGRASKGG